jgi:hypothetical protein
MKANGTENEETFKNFFGFYILWFRLICVPLQTHHPSHCYTLYSLFLTFNTYTVLLTVVADLFQHADDLEHIMENFRVILPVLSAIWVQLSMR